MKKILCIAILILLSVCVLAPSVAMADSVEHKPTVNPDAPYYATSLVDDSGSLIGMAFNGMYFGNSEIIVRVEIYSDENWDFNFYLGDADYSETPPENAYMLTAEQTATKRKVLDMFAQFDKLVRDVDSLVNTQITSSDIYAYNNAAQGTTLKISQHTYNILQLAKEIYADTDGAFNPAVYRLVDLWGFSSRIYGYGNFGLPYDRPVTSQEFWANGYPLPDQKYVEAFSRPSFTDFSDSAVTLTQSDGEYFVTKNVAPVKVDGDNTEYNQWLDLGGIAKGYVVDCIKQMLSQNDIVRYYVDAGTSSTAYGLNYDGKKFGVGLQDPFNIFSSVLGLEISDSVVSTSGQYIRKYKVDGVEYSHIIDGTSGAPAQTGLKSVFVVIPSDNEMWASKGDCLTTALTVMGRDNLVRFVNGYLKEHKISVIAVYQTLDGKKEILSNIDRDDFISTSENFSEFAWALEKEGENFVYNADATFEVQRNPYRTAVIVLACVVGAAAVAMVVYHIIRGKKSLQNVQHARKDKPFKPADIMAYLAVVLVIVALFAYVFGGEKQTWNTLEVVDVQTGEQLFYYNASRKEYKINEQNSQNWQITVENSKQGITVTFSRTVDGKERFNKIEIAGGFAPTVEMVDSVCGFHQDCVRNFGKVDVVDGAIVCSPNKIKVVTH